MKNNERDLSKYTPAYEPVSVRAPTEPEKRIDLTLKAYMDVEMKLETTEEMVRRDSVLAEVRSIFIKWVQFVAVEVLHMPADEAEDAGGELFISGSHRLGVRDIGADIDTVCVAPNFCTRQHFFTYLKEDLQSRPEVKELIAVEEAFVPIISFDYRDVSIDLLFARMAENIIPKDIDILDDRILVGLDEATEKSLNGPRVTNMIFRLVGEKTFPNFLIVLRCIRKWAKKRGLYGNKLGYLGGINCNIMVAFICQLYPNSNPSTLLFRFFKHYRDWHWPDPISLNNIQQNPPGTLLTDERAVWSQKTNAKDLMPLITPAYPAMNSAFNVNAHSFEVMRLEIKRGYDVVEQIIKDILSSKPAQWERLFEPSDFFVKYSHYLACHIVGTGDNLDSRSWTGFVESRIRRLTQYPYLETLPIKKPIQLYPIVSKTAKSEFSTCYFIGFDLDLDLIKESADKNIHIDNIAYNFGESLLDPERGYRGNRVEGLDFFVEHMSWKRLPKELFEPLGGFASAKALRAERGYGVVKKSSGEAEGDKEGSSASSQGPSDGSASGAVHNATDSAQTKTEAQIKTERGTNESKEEPLLQQQQLASQYSLGQRYFPSEQFEGFGAANVDTIEKSRKKLRAEAFGGEANLESVLFNKKISLMKDLPVLLPSKRLFGRHSQGYAPVPNVTWNLLDGK